MFTNSVLNINATEENNNDIFNNFDSLKFIGSQQDYSNSDSIKFDSNNSIKQSKISYPTKYDLRELGLVTSTDNQEGYGMCWTFATTQSAMSRLIERNPFINLSEWHLGYFTYNGDKSIEMFTGNSNVKFYNKGGNSSFATATLSRWSGFISEDVLPYNSQNIDDSLNYQSEYHLTDAYCMNSALNDGASSNSYVDKIKSMILNGNSVAISIYYNSNKYYSKESNSYYCNDKSQAVNHGLTIVGWDDDFYSYDGLTNKPTSKGAWLIKNTYGYQFGDYGYFWLSYESPLNSDVTSYIATSSNNYSTNYTIDDYGWVTSVNSLTDEKIHLYDDYAGNVFTSVNNEDLSAVGIYTTDFNTQYTISIYKDIQSDLSPIGEEVVQTFAGTEQYPGFHTINLENPVPLSTNEKFSVVVHYKNPSYKNTIAIESSVKFFLLQDNQTKITQYNLLEDTLLNNTSANESFVSNDNITWKPTRGTKGIISAYDTDFNYLNDNINLSNLNDGYYAISTLGNVCIKAFTNPHDKVYFSQYGGGLYLNENIELSNPNKNVKIYYTLDGSTPTLDSPVYTEPIKFTGENLTISARTYIDGVLGDTYTETFNQLQAVLSTLCIKESNGTTSTFTETKISKDNQANTNIEYTCNSDVQEINLFAISSGDITIDKDNIISGHETSIDISKLDSNSSITIPINVSKDGCISTNYTLTINKKAPTKTSYDYIDILILKKYLLNLNSSVGYNDVIVYDLNKDNNIDILDYTIMKDKILNKEY